MSKVSIFVCYYHRPFPDIKICQPACYQGPVQDVTVSTLSLFVTRDSFRMSNVKCQPACYQGPVQDVTSVLCPCLSPGIALGCQMSVSLFATRRTFKMSKVSRVSLFVTRRRFRVSKVSYVSLLVSRRIFWMPRVNIPVCH